jgi:hypothetical protein
MKKFHVFVEGVADKKFLHDYLEVEFNTTLKAILNSEGGIKEIKCITSTGGWAKLISEDGETFRKKMKENTANGIINLVVFDADTQKNSGGFAIRKAQIEAWKTTYGLRFGLFLFPNK